MDGETKRCARRFFATVIHFHSVLVSGIIVIVRLECFVVIYCLVSSTICNINMCMFGNWLPGCMEEDIGVWRVQLGLFTRSTSCNVAFVYAFCLTVMGSPMVSMLWVSNAGLHFGSANHVHIGYCFPPLPTSPFLLLSHSFQ